MIKKGDVVLKQRIITAIILVAGITLSIINFSAWGFSLLITAVVLAASWEWSALAGLRLLPARIAFVLTCLLAMAIIVWRGDLLSEQANADYIKNVLAIGCLWWLLALIWVRRYPLAVKWWGSVFVRMMMGLVTLIPAWLAFISLRLNDQGVGYLFILIGLVVCSDTGAYFSGRAWGRSKLAPAVSPGKSWAGFWGGLAASCSFALLVWFIYGSAEMHFIAVLVVAVLTGLASVLGDLLESMIKRHQGIKDSGNILPGHGGLMDRLDSLTAASPVFALSLLILGW